jgi:CRISPR-associated protein Cas2
MLRLIVYDVAHSRRLVKVARICEDYGVRVEYSVFECDLDEKQFARFWGKLEKTIDVTTDRLIAYRICSSCAERIQSIGAVVRPRKPLLYMV